MAFYIKLIRTSEDAAAAEYTFESDGNIGRLAINKSTGEVRLVEPQPGDEKGHHFSRAAAKIRKEWKGGSLPDTTEWAS